MRLPARATAGMFAGALAALAALGGCTPATVVSVTLDLDSYLAADLRTTEATVPSARALRVYLLPGVQVDDVDAGPDENMRLGSLVTVPPMAQYAGAQPMLSVLVDVAVSNLSSDFQVPGATLSVMMGAADAADIYSEGVPASAEIFPAVQAGETSICTVSAVVDSAHPAYDWLLSGAFRTGVSLHLAENPLGAVPVRIEVRVVHATVSAVPFGLAGLGGAP